ncbi:hypothetical protein Tco_0726583 [Tanacetum coccineum]|uniref:Uncharacterized protein n=1 Tax=Tanacetum coccineum TaxID=301880 RepID=A0ABQ4YIC3_9ASTR
MAELKVQLESGHQDYIFIRLMGHDIGSVMESDQLMGHDIKSVMDQLRVNVDAQFSYQYEEVDAIHLRLAGIIAEGFGIVKGVADNVPVFKSMITHLTKNDANEAFDRFNSRQSVTSIDNKVTETTEEYTLKRTVKRCQEYRERLNPYCPPTNQPNRMLLQGAAHCILEVAANNAWYGIYDSCTLPNMKYLIQD